MQEGLTHETPGELLPGRDVLCLPVYSIDAGKRLGEITGLLVRREDCSVLVVRIQRSHSGGKAFLPYRAMKTVGVEIALVDTEAVLWEEIPADERPGLEMNLPGRSVMTHSGEQVGHVVGFGINTLSGRITTFRMEANTSFLSRIAALGRDKTVDIPTEMVISVGPDAVLVQDNVAALLHPSS